MGITSSCLTVTHPRGEWIYPIYTPWDESKMQGVKVLVVCAIGNRDEIEWIKVSRSSGCSGISDIVENMGATVIQSTNPEEIQESDLIKIDKLEAEVQAEFGMDRFDMKIVYIDRDTRVNRCFSSLFLVILSLSVFPCIENVEPQAEIQIFDPGGALMRREVLDLQIMNVYGIGVLPLYLARISASSHFLGRTGETPYQKSIVRQQRLVQHLTDMIFTERTRQIVARASLQHGGKL